MNPVIRTVESLDWITLVIFGSLVFVIIAKQIDYQRFLNFIVLPFNNKYIFMYNKKEKLFNRFHILFTAFQTLNTALFLYFSFKNLGLATMIESPFMFSLLVVALSLFMVVKIALQITNGAIFGSQFIFSEIIFKKMSYMNYGGIVLLGANLVLAYVNLNANIVIFTAILLFLLVNAIGWALVLKNYQNFIANYIFYFILYLCTLEIAPLVILGSFLK